MNNPFEPPKSQVSRKPYTSEDVTRVEFEILGIDEAYWENLHELTKRQSPACFSWLVNAVRLILCIMVALFAIALVIALKEQKRAPVIALSVIALIMLSAGVYFEFILIFARRMRVRGFRSLAAGLTGTVSGQVAKFGVAIRGDQSGWFVPVPAVRSLVWSDGVLRVKYGDASFMHDLCLLIPSSGFEKGQETIFPKMSDTADIFVDRREIDWSHLLANLGEQLDSASDSFVVDADLRQHDLPKSRIVALDGIKWRRLFKMFVGALALGGLGWVLTGSISPLFLTMYLLSGIYLLVILGLGVDALNTLVRRAFNMKVRRTHLLVTPTGIWTTMDTMARWDGFDPEQKDYRFSDSGIEQQVQQDEKLEWKLISPRRLLSDEQCMKLGQWLGSPVDAID